MPSGRNPKAGPASGANSLAPGRAIDTNGRRQHGNRIGRQHKVVEIEVSASIQAKVSDDHAGASDVAGEIASGLASDCAGIGPDRQGVPIRCRAAERQLVGLEVA